MIVKLAAIRYAKSRNYNKVGKKFAAWILPKSAVGDFGHTLLKHGHIHENNVCPKCKTLKQCKCMGLSKVPTTHNICEKCK